MKFTLALTLALALALAGCGGGGDDHHKPGQTGHTATIHIESDPPGAKVYYAGGADESAVAGKEEFIGTTPCEWTCETVNGGFKAVNGRFLQGVLMRPVHVFTAKLDGQSQRKVYHSGNVTASDDKVPARMMFEFPPGK